MTRNTAILGLVLGVMLAAPRSPAQAAAREADHEALRALRKKVVTAISGQDLNALKTCFAKEFVFTTVDQTPITSQTDLVAYYERMFQAPDAPLSGMETDADAEILTRFTGPNTGYCYGTAKDTYTLRRNGRRIQIPSRWTCTMVKEEGMWKIAAAHAGVNFLDNPVVEARSMSLWRKLLVLLRLSKYPGQV